MGFSDLGGFPSVGGPTLVDPFGRPLQGAPRLALPAFDPSKETAFFDDFTGTVPAGAIGSGNWAKTLNQGGSLANTGGLPGNDFGCWTWGANTTIANNFFALTNGLAIYLPAGSIHEWRIRTPSSLSNSTNQYYIIAGMSDARFTTSAAANDVTIQYTHTNTNGAWALAVKNSGSGPFRFYGTIPVQPSTWYRLTLWFDPFGTSASLYVNDVYQCTATAINPTTMAIGAGHIAATTGNNEIIYFDYFHLRQKIDRR